MSAPALPVSVEAPAHAQTQAQKRPAAHSAGAGGSDSSRPLSMLRVRGGVAVDARTAAMSAWHCAWMPTSLMPMPMPMSMPLPLPLRARIGGGRERMARGQFCLAACEAADADQHRDQDEGQGNRSLLDGGVSHAVQPSSSTWTALLAAKMRAMGLQTPRAWAKKGRISRIDFRGRMWHRAGGEGRRLVARGAARPRRGRGDGIVYFKLPARPAGGGLGDAGTGRRRSGAEEGAAGERAGAKAAAAACRAAAAGTRGDVRDTSRARLMARARQQAGAEHTGPNNGLFGRLNPLLPAMPPPLAGGYWRMGAGGGPWPHG